LVRLNSDGTLDTSFNAERDFYAQPLAVQQDGKILVWGEVLRLEIDGTSDPFFESPVIQTPVALKLAPNNTAVIAAGLVDMNGIQRWGLTRIRLGPLDRLAPPEILEQPANQTVNEGDAAFFFVQATTTPITTAQWLFNGNALPGATNALLALGTARIELAGSYQLVLSNRFGGQWSVPVALTVLPSKGAATHVRAVNPQYRPGEFQLILPYTAAGSRFLLESTESLTNPSWSVQSMIEGNGLMQVLTDSPTISAQKFYRIRLEE
jgi:hypothetical protein